MLPINLWTFWNVTLYITTATRVRAVQAVWGEKCHWTRLSKTAHIQCVESERHKTSPRSWITCHVYVHIVIGPIVLFVIIKGVRWIGYAVSATWSWWVLLQCSITRSWPLPSRRGMRRHVTGWEVRSRHSVRSCGQRLSRLSQLWTKWNITLRISGRCVYLFRVSDKSVRRV